MSDYKIDKNVPIPRPRSSLSVYPFRVMEVEDSFFTPGAENLNRINSAAYRFCKDHPEPRKFIVRTVTLDDGTEGVRCWRVK